MKHVLYPIAFICAFMCGCTGRYTNSSSALPGGDTLTSHSELLTMVDYGDYLIADVTNPWDTTKLLARYVLVPREREELSGLPEGTVLRTPLQSSLVYSGVHGGAICELGAVDAVTAVADGGYFSVVPIVEGLKRGSITDVGNSMSPSVEKIVALMPEAILASPYQNAGYGAIETLGIPVIECADYMESTPLGRAEWIKLLGALYGAADCADSIFQSVSGKYEDLKRSVADVEYRPTVITEQLTDGVWYVPGGRSYMARMLEDAGAVYPWSSDSSTGSLQLDFAAVLDRASDADYWLIRSYGPLSLSTLMSNNPLNAKFKAALNGGVYVCDTSESSLFDEFPFHPEKLLSDYINIFHPEVSSRHLNYYRKAE